MARPSSIDLLPKDAREALQAWLRDPSITQSEATERTNDLLEELGLKQNISRQAVNRYDIKMREVGQRLQQSRQMAEMWMGKLGAEPDGNIGRLVNQIMQTLALDVSLAVQDGEVSAAEAPEVAKMLKNMAIAMERLEKAASENVKREAEIRDKVKKEAADTAAKIAKKGGMSKETVDSIKAGILGVKQ